MNEKEPGRAAEEQLATCDGTGHSTAEQPGAEEEEERTADTDDDSDNSNANTTPRERMLATMLQGRWTTSGLVSSDE